MQFNIPTLLTLFRVILIPFFVLAFYLPFSWAPFACALIFFVAAVTDWFDGFLARRWNQSTRFGAFLDPVADKVMVAIAMVLVAEHYHTWWVTLPAATMIARQIIISHESAMENLVGVLAVALIFVVKKYFLMNAEQKK